MAIMYYPTWYMASPVWSPVCWSMHSARYGRIFCRESSKKDLMRKLLSILAALSFLQAATAQEDTVQKKVEYPAGYQAQTDVVYASGMDWSMKHDIYFNPAAAKPTPVLFNIHGGGWNHGTKESQSGFSAYFKMGYAVVNVEYRLTPQATAPAAVEDVRSSLLYIV